MNYEKAYNELAKKAKSFLDKWDGVEAIDSELAMKELKDMFNEFTESEDERIRKMLHKLVFQWGNGHPAWTSDKEEIAKILAWLEKQGEQKPAPKVEPKFKVGDYVVGKYISGYITEVRDDCYLLDYQGFSIDKQDNYHLWTIQDAKPGDVLVDNYPFIFEKVDTSGHCYAYCGINAYNEFMIESEGDSGEWTWGHNVHPATNEQINLLFQKMKEADYEWDSEKLKLTKIDQEEKDTPKFKVKRGEWYVCTNTFVLKGKIIAIKGQTYQSKQEDDTITCEDNCLFIDTHDGKASDYFRLWTIEDAKSGDVIYESATDSILLFRSQTCGWLKVFCDYWRKKDKCTLTDYGDYGKISEMNLSPATKEQRSLLFQEMEKIGYEFDSEKLELRKINQGKNYKPKFKVGDWVVCCDYEPVQIIGIRTNVYEMSNGDIRPFYMVDDNDNYHLWSTEEERVLYTPKFKVGDWVIDKQDIVHQIANVVENVTYHTYGYDIVGGGYFNDNTEGVRLWTIEDAIPGDILTDKDGCTFIFRDLDTDFDGTMVTAYCGINIDGYFVLSEEGEVWANPEEVYPADSDDRNNLFDKMRGAAYEWDSTKLELNTVNEKPNKEVDKVESVDCTKTKQGIIDWAVDFLKYKGFEDEADRLASVSNQPKYNWTEVDTNRINNICDFIQGHFNFADNAKEEAVKYLQSLKEFLSK